MAIRAPKTLQPATMVPITQTGAIAGTMDFAIVANPEEATEEAIEEATTAVTAVVRNATFAASKAAGRFVIELTRKKMHISVFMLQQRTLELLWIMRCFLRSSKA
jgi:hypothetical protein